MPMTDLEIFDFVAAHLLRQGKQSRCASAGSLYHACLYRNTDGTSCAIGCLIKDEFYDPEMEGTQIPDNPMAQAAVAKSIGRKLVGHVTDVLNMLQRVHDNDQPRHWPRRLSEARSDLFPDAPPIPA